MSMNLTNVHFNQENIGVHCFRKNKVVPLYFQIKNVLDKSKYVDL